MFTNILTLNLKRTWPVLILVGSAVFAGSFVVLAGFAGGITAAVRGLSEILLIAILSACIAQVAMIVAGALVSRHMRQENKRMRTAIDNMAQGLCMFDSSERLVVCNTKYYQMYGLELSDVKPGSTLTEVLTKRVAKGTFSRDPQQYRKDFLTEIAKGRTTVHEVKSTGGRLLLVMNHPMTDGGWIGTHEDITERRQAEEQRTTMQQQEERRAIVDDAISAFRQRAETLLKSAAASAGKMRLTAANLLNTSGRTSQSAEDAVRTSNKASKNVESAAAAADELSSSIAEIDTRSQPDRRRRAHRGRRSAGGQ